MTPRKKPAPTPQPNPQTEAEAEQKQEGQKPQTITVAKGDTSAKLEMYGRAGTVLLYAISYAIVVGVTGLVIVQILRALQLTGAKIPDAMGLLLWILTTLICACCALWRA
jgi:hypothetical protein